MISWSCNQTVLPGKYYQLIKDEAILLKTFTMALSSIYISALAIQSNLLILL